MLSVTVHGAAGGSWGPGTRVLQLSVPTDPMQRRTESTDGTPEQQQGEILPTQQPRFLITLNFYEFECHIVW